MADELRHEPTAAGTTCAQTDWEDVDIHRFQGQAVGDIVYASTNTQLRRLAVGANGEVLELAAGVPSWAAKGFSSRVRAYLSSVDQVINDSTESKVLLDAETYDGGGEFNNRTLSAAADATEANKLHDADGGFEAADVGATVWNTTDNTYTTVSGFVDAGELDLTDDIMVNGENYVLYHSRFTATVAGYYLILGNTVFKDLNADKQFTAIIRVNGVNVSLSALSSGVVTWQGASIMDIRALSISDYVELYVAQYTGGNESLTKGSFYTYMAIHRLS